MLANSPLIKLLKRLSREEPARVSRCREVIQDLVDCAILKHRSDVLGIELENVSLGEMDLALELVENVE